MRKLIGLSVVLFTAAIMTMAFMPKEDHGGYQIGDTVNDFKLMNVDKTMVSLDSYEGVEGWIVVFTCNTCPYSVMYEDRIIELHNTYAPKGYPVVAINPNDPEVKAGDSFAEMQKRSSEKAFPFKYLFDEGQNVYPLWGASATPHAYVVSKDKVLRYVGAIDDSPRDASAVSVNYVGNAIAAIKAGETPNPSHTKAIGCSIKTKNATMKSSGKKKRKS
jgi:peroxiredoxin